LISAEPQAHAGEQEECKSRIRVESLRVSDEIKALIRDGKPEGQRNEAIFAAIRAMIKAGYGDEEIIAVLVDPANGLSENPRDKGLAWLTGEIKRAREKPDRDNSSETPFGAVRPDPDRLAFHSIAGSVKGPNGDQPSSPPSPSARRPVDSPARPHEEPINLKACSGNEPGPAAKEHEATPAATLEIQRLARLSSLDYEREREAQPSVLAFASRFLTIRSSKPASRRMMVTRRARGTRFLIPSRNRGRMRWTASNCWMTCAR
jgi:hypothetical protein